MKKYILFLLAFLGLTLQGIQAQSRKLLSQYHTIPGYFNPSLTALGGSEIKGLVRNQWGPLSSNPKSFFLGADIEFSDFSGTGATVVEGKNAMGFALLTDSHGAFRENQLLVNYATRIRIAEKANVRLGAGVFYQGVRLDGNQLTFEQQNDPKLSEYLGKVSDQQFLDFNLGIGLTHPNYYFGYSIQRVNSGKISSGDSFLDKFPKEHLIQAGYRHEITEDFQFSTDLLFRSWEGGRDILDINLKVLMKETFWLGFGHRFDFTSNIQGGVKFKRFAFGYVYEFPSSDNYLLPGNIQEFMLTYQIGK